MHVDHTKSQPTDDKPSLKGAWLGHVDHLNFGGHHHISGTVDRLRRCQLSSPASVINTIEY